MPLIKSISGIRGTLGDQPGEDLTTDDVKKFTAAFGQFLRAKNWGDCIVVGRDARPSGEKFAEIVGATLAADGFRVINLGLATTPTVEVAVIQEKAAGGIVITASHNPIEWNALKLLDNQGEFFSAEDGARILTLAESTGTEQVVSTEGQIISDNTYDKKHIDLVLASPLVDAAAIGRANFKIVVDGINSVGGLVIPELLQALLVKAENIIKINCEPTGQFAHRPEPIEDNLVQILAAVKAAGADLGLVVDPDVDRLAFIDENGAMFGEEYTLVAIGDYVLKNFQTIETAEPGRYAKATASNLSSSRALKDVGARYGASYETAAVGEVNVVTVMKKTKAVIGGEGNGGVIFPSLHYGRDALIGTALFLSALAVSGEKLSVFRKTLPAYFMVKDKLTLSSGLDLKKIFSDLKNDYASENLTEIDGLKIDWPDAWVHLRASNTEPIVRLYAEAKTLAEAEVKAKEIKDKILAYIK